MNSRPRVVFVASEIFPFAKTGGLADVVYALPAALGEVCDCMTVMPLYRFIDRSRFGIAATGDTFSMRLGGCDYEATLYSCEYNGVSCYFIYEPLLCECDSLYGTPESGYEDNALRFGRFDRAVVEWVHRRGDVHIVHLHDWQSALCALWLKASDLRVVYTIHNLAYQGVFEKSSLQMLGIDPSYFTIDGLEFYDKVSFMKAGIAYADAVTTVSPRYANEILTPEFGCGLEGFLRYHQDKLSGIVNGIDTLHFSPDSDSMLAVAFDASSQERKAQNRQDFLDEAGLEDVSKPLFAFIGRLTWQKGVDELIAVLPYLAGQPVNIALIGEGEAAYEQQFELLADTYANIYLFKGYDELLSHRLYASAHFLLMPSRFEPCGLNQLIAMHYGAVPIVHGVGGLSDTVADMSGFDSASVAGFGIVYERSSVYALKHALKRALAIENFDELSRHNMEVDVSWGKSAARYFELYEALLKAQRAV